MPAVFSGKKMRSARKRKRITQEVLAERAALGDRYVRDLESGRKNNPSAALVYRISIVLDVQMEELMEEQEEAQ